MTDIDVERLIADSSFTNPGHKRRLRECLFEQARELRFDELAAVAGGNTAQENTTVQPENNDDEWARWPTPEDEPK